jgi:hypothetical protein
MKTNYVNFTVKNLIVKEMSNIDSIISSTMHRKFLGLNIQCDLTWNKHIEETIKKTEYHYLYD